MSLKPWREVAVPHEDVRKGTFKQSEFAADITSVNNGQAPAEYQDPELFFKRTYITEGMKRLLDQVLRRLSGGDGDPVIQLQTAFGGGKTHTMLAVWHVAHASLTADRLAGVGPILDAAGLTGLVSAKSPCWTGRPTRQTKRRRAAGQYTLGRAWQQLGAERATRLSRRQTEQDRPFKETLKQLLNQYAPCVIHDRRADGYPPVRQPLSGGSYDSNITFVRH